MRSIEEIDKTIRILVVDDVFSARRIVKRLLGILGFTNIVEAESGKQAVEFLRTERFDLVITDLNLGDIKGTEIARNLRDEKGQQTPAIMITSEMSRDDAAEATKVGVNQCILKPFNKELLAAKIIAALEPGDSPSQKSDSQ